DGGDTHCDAYPVTRSKVLLRLVDRCRHLRDHIDNLTHANYSHGTSSNAFLCDRHSGNRGLLIHDTGAAQTFLDLSIAVPRIEVIAGAFIVLVADDAADQAKHHIVIVEVENVMNGDLAPGAGADDFGNVV